MTDAQTKLDQNLWDFIRLFIYSWLIYYSEKLSIPAATLGSSIS